MAAYAYDDFRVTLSARDDGQYDLRAQLPDGSEQHGAFSVPFSVDQLETAISGLASRRGRSMSATVVTREVTPAAEVAAATNSAERLGLALARALFADGIGDGFDAARATSEANRKGLRLTLSLAGAPALLSLPWEFLFVPPRFIASQRRTPLVRQLDCGSHTAAPRISDIVRILGVIASPSDLTPLDVEAERSRVDKAVAKMVSAGRVQLDWLEPASPRSVREALRDNNYHILHYVGHSSFTTANEGAIYLQDEDGLAVEVDGTLLANLLADQSNLRLAVLNSCEGARTTLHDPYAGVATTLIQLGVPAVVAMQFEISDDAAILFADELYTNLIGRQDPIDAAVAEARKAIYVEVDRVEWATPVLFVRDPDVQLFDFTVPEAPLPPPAPPGLPPPKVAPLATLATPAPTKPAAEDPSNRGKWRSRLLMIGVLTVLASIVVFVVSLVLFYMAGSLSDSDIVARGDTDTNMSFERTAPGTGRYTVYLDNGSSSFGSGVVADDVSCAASFADTEQHFNGRDLSSNLIADGKEPIGSFSAPTGPVTVSCTSQVGGVGHLVVAKGSPPSLTAAVVWWLISVVLLLAGLVLVVIGVIRAVRRRRQAAATTA